MHSPGSVERDFQPTDHFRVIAGRLGNVLEHVQQSFRADELRLPYPRDDMPRDFVPDRLEILFFDIGGIDQHVGVQIGVVETDLIDPDSAPAFDSLHQ
jgi:Predicted PP-loop superfamily ATPase